MVPEPITRSVGKPEYERTRYVSTSTGFEMTTKMPRNPLSSTLAVGRQLKKGEALCTIADLSHVWVLATVSAAEVGFIQAGRRCLVTQRGPYDAGALRCVGCGSDAYHARVKELLPLLDATTRVRTVRLEVDNSQLTLQSGMPIPITQVTNFNAFAGFGIQRPNRVADPRLPSSERSTARWFDTHAFQVAPQFTLGDSSRNPVRGPGYQDVDLALVKRTPIGGGRTAVELRVEAFNLTNTPPLGAPNGVLGAPGFGSITTAGDPRVVQLGVKVLF